MKLYMIYKIYIFLFCSSATLIDMMKKKII